MSETTKWLALNTLALLLLLCCLGAWVYGLYTLFTVPDAPPHPRDWACGIVVGIVWGWFAVLMKNEILKAWRELRRDVMRWKVDREIAR